MLVREELSCSLCGLVVITGWTCLPVCDDMVFHLVCFDCGTCHKVYRRRTGGAEYGSQPGPAIGAWKEWLPWNPWRLQVSVRRDRAFGQIRPECVFDPTMVCSHCNRQGGLTSTGRRGLSGLPWEAAC